MNGYERVLAAIARREPDRVPVMELYIHPRVIESLCPGGGLFDLVERLDLDGVFVGRSHLPEHAASSERYHVDSWGIKFARTAEAYTPVDGPIKSEADLDRYQPPDPHDPALVAEIRRAAARFKGKRFIGVLTRSDFMSAADVRGLPQLLSDFVLNPTLAHRVTRMVNDYYCEFARCAVQAGADGVVLADDWAFKTAPFMSPKHFREFVLPYFERSVRAVKEAGGYAIKHSDGNLWPILDMTVAAGIDVLNPIQPDAGMDIGDVKQRVGGRVCLGGNINCGYTLSEAPVGEVVREVKDAIRKAGPGGGYIMMSSNSLHSSVRPENYAAMVETTRAFGRYPLDLAALAS